MKLSDWMNSINFTKENLIRGDDGKLDEDLAKSFPSYVVMRTLSYHVDCIGYVAILNQMMTKDHNMTLGMQYEFLLHTIPKRKRFAKWVKPEFQEALNMIMEYTNVSYDAAKGYLRLMNNEQITQLLSAKGGKQ